MWINSDDQGRLSGDPDEIKYAVCPNVDDISKTDIPELLKELEEQGFLKVYPTSKTKAVQMLDWWEEQRLQWAWPSRYPPPQGWQDRLRYKPNPKEIVTVNWLPPSRLGSTLPSEPPNSLPSISPDKSGDILPDSLSSSPLTTPFEEEEENIPGAPGGSSSPSLTDLSLFEFLTSIFPNAFGRSPNSREFAQLRDLGKEISTVGGATAEQVYDAFKEACDQNKFSISYVRAILLDWLGVARAPP